MMNFEKSESKSTPGKPAGGTSCLVASTEHAAVREHRRSTAVTRVQSGNAIKKKPASSSNGWPREPFRKLGIEFPRYLGMFLHSFRNPDSNL